MSVQALKLRGKGLHEGILHRGGDPAKGIKNIGKTGKDGVEHREKQHRDLAGFSAIRGRGRSPFFEQQAPEGAQVVQ